MRLITFCTSYCFLLLSLWVIPAFLPAQVRIGAERTELYYPLLEGKKIGIVANNASVVGKSNVVDILAGQGFDIVKIFSPEHGFRVSAEAGQLLGNSMDSATGIPVISLYGKKKRPGKSDLDSLDLVLFDIQDVGVRFYTYLSTLAYVMDACADQGLPVVVLDRPNPNGFFIDGPVLEKQYASFVGLHPVPVVYGMTIGEYARMVNGEGWLDNGSTCSLRVIPLENYTHATRYVIPSKPSPNLPDAVAISLYPSLCFFEGTVISVGRGTVFPFQVYGHPELDYGDFFFTPESIPGVSLHPPLEGLQCRGEDLRQYYNDHPGELGKLSVGWLIKAYQGLNDKKSFFTGYFNQLSGNSSLQEQIIHGTPEHEIRQSWSNGIKKFKKIREKYLLYDP